MPEELTPAQRLFAEVVRERMLEAAVDPDSYSIAGMTARRIEALYWAIVVGRENLDVADALTVSVKTVESHLSACRMLLDYPSNHAMRHDLLRRFVRLEVTRELAPA
jgi:DNA-binding NarL/FixJ family response regulator